MGEQCIAEKPFGKNSSRSRGEGAMTAATVTLFQFKANDFLSHRVHFNNGTGLTALGVQRAAALALRAFERRIGFEGDFGRRSRGPKGTFFGGPFLIA